MNIFTNAGGLADANVAIGSLVATSVAGVDPLLNDILLTAQDDPVENLVVRLDKGAIIAGTNFDTATPVAGAATIHGFNLGVYYALQLAMGETYTPAGGPAITQDGSVPVLFVIGAVESGHAKFTVTGVTGTAAASRLYATVLSPVVAFEYGVSFANHYVTITGGDHAGEVWHTTTTGLCGTDAVTWQLQAVLPPESLPASPGYTPITPSTLPDGGTPSAPMAPFSANVVMMAEFPDLAAVEAQPAPLYYTEILVIDVGDGQGRRFRYNSASTTARHVTLDTTPLCLRPSNRTAGDPGRWEATI